MGIVRKGLSVVFRLIIAIMIMLIVMFVYQSFKKTNEPTSFFGYQPLTVLSNSMNPSFETGDMFFAKKVDPGEVKVDDVITFKETGGKLITHRVIEVVNNSGEVGFVTKGDNNNVKDEEVVKGENLIGKQAFIIPNAGFIAKFLRSPIGLIVLILLPLAIYIGLEVYDRKKSVGKTRNIVGD
ncbi:signal peptidase I [Sporosarcina sp. NPDC096371]|uniref:signal peptidase I n=1 Tax=Sporosarcina sp. NPDC096371 TaxID=3364530 RepID=UPI003817A184